MVTEQPKCFKNSSTTVSHWFNVVHGDFQVLFFHLIGMSEITAIIYEDNSCAEFKEIFLIISNSVLLGGFL